MSKVMVNDTSLQDIAAAIREKTESTDTFLPSAMGAAIRAMEMGGLGKWATGVVSSTTSTISASGLDFTPRIVVAFRNVENSGVGTGIVSVAATQDYISLIHGSGSNTGFTSSSRLTRNFTEGGFTLTATTSRTFNGEYRWIAYE